MAGPWHRHFFYRKQVLKTTWKLRIFMVVVLSGIIVVPHKFWAAKIGKSLVCKEQVNSSDAVLVENFDTSYLAFERAGDLKRAAVAPRVFVPTGADGNSNLISRQFAEVVARAARLDTFEPIPVRLKEPISLNVARQIRDFLKAEDIKSVIVVSPGFRSRRSEMVYKAVLEPAGIRVGCQAALGRHELSDWESSWHGIQETVLQFGKLQYYRFYVLLK